jgi:CheY-like chemotaxis protein/HPt (histidine-containing phosphotransfer) domain-containing protein
MRTYLRTMLQVENVQIDEAGSLREAREFLRNTAAASPDFIVLDLELPDGNGLDLMPDVPLTTRVIALTADVSREIELQCRKAGCDLVLEKNHELSTLREIIAGQNSGSTTTHIRSLPPSGSYITFLAEVLIELDDAQRKADFLAVRRIAHRLRGTAIHFGYPGIGAAAKSVSSALRAGRLDQLDTATSSLRDRISDALETHHLKTRNTAITEAPSCEY